MIRQDYFMKMVQELAQALARVLFLKQRQDYSGAMDEIRRALARFWNLPPDQSPEFSLEKLIEVCRSEEGVAGEKFIALADLLKEQGDLYALQDQPDDSLRSRALALGLYLEALNERETMVSVNLLSKVELLTEQTRGARLPAEVIKRLLRYYEARGMLGRAEDVLFDWLDTGDPNAPEGGLAFYQRQTARSDDELNQGNLPRNEVEAGRQELLQRAARG